MIQIIMHRPGIKIERLFESLNNEALIWMDSFSPEYNTIINKLDVKTPEEFGEKYLELAEKLFFN